MSIIQSLLLYTNFTLEAWANIITYIKNGNSYFEVLMTDYWTKNVLMDKSLEHF